VVHLAAEASPSAEWPAVLRSNIIGTRNVFEAARLAGVRRVVFASSTHAVAGHEQAAGPALYDLDDPRRFGVDVAPWPDSAYGVSKLFGEALGRWYSDAHGVSVICLRIGWVWDRPDDELVRRRWPDDEPGLTDEVRAARRRSRAIWLSHRDCARVFRAAIEAPAGLRYAVVYATSGNPRQIWDLEPARRLLGFEPLDGAPGVIA
jgi:nucleoside-diphosphate-sugar epimerase